MRGRRELARAGDRQRTEKKKTNVSMHDVYRSIHIFIACLGFIALLASVTIDEQKKKETREFIRRLRTYTPQYAT